MWDKPQLLMWFANLLTALASLLLFFAVIYLAVHSPLFPVRQIAIDGNLAYVTRQQLDYVTKNELQGTFFTLDLDKTRQAFEKLPWVRRVDVRRRWPDRLEVHIEEHRSLARWGTDSLLNTYGERFDAATSDPLPVLEGPDGTEKQVAEGYKQFASALAPVNKKPTHVWLSERRAWRMELDHKLIVEVGRDDALERVQRFVAAYPNSLGLLNRSFEYVDLRYPHGFAVQLPGYEPQARSASGAARVTAVRTPA